MEDPLTYADALKILGFQKGRLLGVLNAVTSVGLATWAATALATGVEAGIPLGLYEVKNDILSIAPEVFRRLSKKLSGASRFDRSERLAAAHAVLVIAAFYEWLDFFADSESLDIDRSEMATQATGGSLPESYVDLIGALVQAKLPLPESHRPYKEVREEIIDLYRSMSQNVARYVRGNIAWDRISKARRDKLDKALSEAANSAITNYDQKFQQLATDSREFAIWANMVETHALGQGLAALTESLNAMMAQNPGGRSRAHLITSYRAALDESVASSGRAPEGVLLPPLGKAYVNPHFQVSEVRRGDSPASKAWWATKVTHNDIEAYLTGYLTSPRAARAPLVVLGEPGSGKSKLTEIIAARLSDTSFLPIRVELRDVPAESTVLRQIEEAIVRGPGEHVPWHDLLAAAPRDLPVVLLDGFDEVLQAANTNRYDYLEQVAEFQHQQRSIGHPIAVIVTTRTVVADRVRFPPESLALRLLPFAENQITNWLETWQQYNAAPFAKRGLIPLTPETALAHRELAEQPLLLLMLALYDATDNALQRSTELDAAGLYENLLMDFALREVRKSEAGRALSDTDQFRAATRELRRLAVVALAMFVRGQQSIGDTLLNRDLELLFPERIDTVDLDAGLTPSQRATGKFFFVHKSEARPGNEIVRSYEFLHATFGEFLVAWLAARALRDLVSRHESENPESTARPERLDDGYLFAVLSFRCLGERASITAFLADLLAHLTDEERTCCREMVRILIIDSLYVHDQRSHREYQPIRLPLPARLAAYSANLFIFLTKLLESEVDLANILASEDCVRLWFSYAHLWKGNFTADEWAGVRHELNPESGPVVCLYKDGSTIALFSSHEFGTF